MSRLLTVAACALLLGGCGTGRAFYDNPTMHLYQAGAIFLGADIVSLASTDKTVDDHIIGMATDQDCSTLRASHGGPWCIPNPPPVAMVDRTEYCYKSLGERASCFTQPIARDQPSFLGSYTTQVPAP
jgi:hypothetical protein